MYQDLQAFRISAGWTVTRHLFFEEEPDPAHMDMFKESLFCAEDTRRHRAIDLEWVRENDTSGHYELRVINLTPIYDELSGKLTMDYDYESPYYELQSKDKSQIVSEINRLMWELPILKEERILKAPGLVDEPSESFRLRLNEHGPTNELCQEIIKLGNKKIQILLIDHPEVTPRILRTLIESEISEKLKKKAQVLLQSKRYKKAHGLWADKSSDKQ